MPVIAKAALTAQKGLVVPGLQELLEEGVAVHTQRATDALNTAKVGLTSALHIESHPVAHTTQERYPRVILVQDLKQMRDSLFGEWP